MKVCFSAMIFLAKTTTTTLGRAAGLPRRIQMFSAPSGLDFGKSFQIPDLNQKLDLEVHNYHANDVFLTFDNSQHLYYYNNVQMTTSVTGLVEQFFDKFNPDEAINKMMSGNNWPREGYLHPDGVPYSAQEIKRKWDSISLYARNTGTWMHHNIELYLNKMPFADNLSEMPIFFEFERDEIIGKDIKPFRTEWRIAAPDKGIGGSVDFVGGLADGTFCLMDWKRAKNLADKGSKSFGRRGKAPLNHLDDCDLSKYYLQLNIYRYILQNYYDIQVSEMMLASFYPHANEDGNKPRYFASRVPVWEEEVEAVMKTLMDKSTKQ